MWRDRSPDLIRLAAMILGLIGVTIILLVMKAVS